MDRYAGKDGRFMKLIADTHTHTVASTHAYSTLQEMVHGAAEKGLFAIGITDHGYEMPGGPGTWYFTNLHTVPNRMEGVWVLRGAEVNVMDYEGRLDIPEKDLQRLDWVVASIHSCCMPQGVTPTRELCTQLWLQIAQNPYVNVIGHSGSPAYAYNYERVIPEFGRQGKLVEINSHSFEARPDYIPNCRRIAQLCMEYRVPVVVNSDAHFSASIGDFSAALAMLEEMGFPEELIVNSSKERFCAYLREHTRFQIEGV